MVPIPEGSETYSEESSSSTPYGSTQELLDQPGGLPPDLQSSQSVTGEERAPVHGACELSG